MNMFLVTLYYINMFFSRTLSSYVMKLFMLGGDPSVPGICPCKE